MPGDMQDWELRVSGLLDHAAFQHGSREIVTRWADGSQSRTSWAGVRHDALRMVQALRRMDVYPGERVATLAMNHGRHLAAWFGATGAGCVLHTLNPRLFDEQLAWIVNHAEDTVLMYDAAFRPLVERILPSCPTIRRTICFDARSWGPDFEDWLAAEDGEADWTSGCELAPCMLCYTSGTTGDPKGVLYSHRSQVLHTLAMIAPSALDLAPRSVVLPVVPMFHANNWGLPWACAATGAKMVWSQTNEAEALCALMDQELVTHVAGVPAVWFAMFEHLDRTGAALPPIRQALSGGSAVPRSVVERLMRAGVRVAQAWGMTETSPIATVAYEPAGWDDMSFDEQVTCKSSQGRPLYGVEVRVVGLEGQGAPLPHDGISAGALQVRGPWAVKRYFRAEDDAVDHDQWFDTGDVATIAADGTLHLTDRTKDLIKSGGEWISSVELENAAVGHPEVIEAAAIGVPHPRWDERPLLVAVRKPGSVLGAEDLRNYLAGKVARWWLPDAIEFVGDLPHTGSGKLDKKALRLLFADYTLPV